MPSLEERLQQLQDAGVQDDVLADLRKAYDASPIRKERDEAAAEAKRVADENAALKARLTASAFKDAGVKLDPSLLNLPSDLDTTDVDKVRGWAIEKGLAEQKPDTPREELDAHQRIASASTEGQAPGANQNEARNRALKAQSEDEFWANAGEARLTGHIQIAE